MSSGSSGALDPLGRTRLIELKRTTESKFADTDTQLAKVPLGRLVASLSVHTVPLTTILPCALWDCSSRISPWPTLPTASKLQSGTRSGWPRTVNVGACSRYVGPSFARPCPSTPRTLALDRALFPSPPSSQRLTPAAHCTHACGQAAAPLPAIRTAEAPQAAPITPPPSSVPAPAADEFDEFSKMDDEFAAVTMVSVAPTVKAAPPAAATAAPASAVVWDCTFVPHNAHGCSSRVHPAILELTHTWARLLFVHPQPRRRLRRTSGRTMYVE